MHRFHILIGILAFSASVSGATLLSTASCASYPVSHTVLGTTGADCSLSDKDGVVATANASTSAYRVGASEENRAIFPQTTPFEPTAYALASLDEDLRFTITGGSGSGLILPHLSMWVGLGLPPFSAEASASLGDLKMYVSAPNTCESCSYWNQTQYIPFTFDQPFTLHLSLFAHAWGDGVAQLAGAGAWAQFEGLDTTTVYLQDMQPFHNFSVQQEIVTPEPVTAVLAGSALLGIALLRFRRKAKI